MSGYGSRQGPMGAEDPADNTIFPTYPYPNPSPRHNPEPGRPAYADPQDEAYAAYQGYQANAVNSYPLYQPPVQDPYRQTPPPWGRSLPNAPTAVPSLVLGILSPFCYITGPVGLGLGIAALKRISAEPHAYGGRGLAIAGVVTSAVGTLMMLLIILSIVAS